MYLIYNVIDFKLSGISLSVDGYNYGNIWYNSVKFKMECAVLFIKGVSLILKINIKYFPHSALKQWNLYLMEVF